MEIFGAIILSFGILLSGYLVTKLIDFVLRIAQRKKEDIYILNYILQKYNTSVLVWESQKGVNCRLYRTNIGRQSLEFWIWKDGSCWLEVGELRLKSRIYPELKLIMKDLKKDFKELSPHEKILVNLGIDKAIQRQEKIETIIRITANKNL